MALPGSETEAAQAAPRAERGQPRNRGGKAASRGTPLPEPCAPGGPPGSRGGHHELRRPVRTGMAGDEGAGALAVLPYEPSHRAARWILKMHGCVTRPDDI